jgi:tRNA (adenine-N(1)-)-methyltransferase non-catalytic subunit
VINSNNNNNNNNNDNNDNDDNDDNRHKNIITILKSSTRLLCQLNYAKGPSKICHLRMDSLSLMLALGNIRAHSNVVVMETCQGLLTGAVLERMGGHGSVVQVFFGDNPVRTILETFDHLSVSDKSILLQYPLDNIKSLLCSSSQQPSVITDALHSCIPHNEEEREVIREGDDVSSGDEREAKRRCHDDGSHPGDDNNDSVKDIKRKERKENYLKAAALLQRRQMDGLLIACRFHPENILMSLLEFIAPSRPIVVYCQFQEPLVQCYRSLKESGRIFNIQLSETWCRKYQVLQDRTHPVVNMDGQSGYLLHGITLNQ